MSLHQGHAKFASFKMLKSMDTCSSSGWLVTQSTLSSIMFLHLVSAKIVPGYIWSSICLVFQ